jgi:hypothetical protein
MPRFKPPARPFARAVVAAPITMSRTAAALDRKLGDARGTRARCPFDSKARFGTAGELVRQGCAGARVGVHAR